MPTLLGQSGDPICFKCGCGGKVAVLHLEGAAEGGGEFRGDGGGIRDADAAQVLGLEAEVAAAHADAVAVDEEFADGGHEDAAQDAEVPGLRSDPVEIVLGIGLAGIEHGKEALLDIGDVELGLRDEAEGDAVDGLVPILRAVLFRGVAAFEEVLMWAQVGGEAGVSGEIDEACFVPGIQKVVAGPFDAAGLKIAGEGEGEQAVRLNVRLLSGDEDAVGTGGDADADAGAGSLAFEGQAGGFEVLEKLQGFRRGAGPRFIAMEPIVEAGGAEDGAGAGGDDIADEGGAVGGLDAGQGLGDGDGALLFPGDDGDGGVGGDLGLEGGDVVGLDDVADGVALRGDELAEGAAVVIEHPAIGADVGADAAALQLEEGSLVKGDVDVRPAAHGAEAAAVEGGLAGGNLLEADVGRIADDEIGDGEAERGFEEIADLDPLPGKLGGDGGRDLERNEGVLNHPDGALCGQRIKLEGLECGGGLEQRCVVEFAGLYQAPDHGAEEGSVTCRWLQSDHSGERALREVTGKIQNQLHHPRLGVNHTGLAPNGKGSGKTHEFI